MSELGRRLCWLFIVAQIARALGGAASVHHNWLEQYNAGATSEDGTREPDVRLTYNETTVHSSGQYVEVAVEGVGRPRAGDLLALFTPPGAHLHGAAPVKWENLTEASAGYLSNGAAKLAFQLVNLRHDMQFVFVRGGPEAPVVAAEGPVLRNTNPNEPTGVHLLLGRDPT